MVGDSDGMGTTVCGGTAWRAGGVRPCADRGGAKRQLSLRAAAQHDAQLSAAAEKARCCAVGHEARCDDSWPPPDGKPSKGLQSRLPVGRARQRLCDASGALYTHAVTHLAKDRQCAAPAARKLRCNETLLDDDPPAPASRRGRSRTARRDMTI